MNASSANPDTSPLPRRSVDSNPSRIVSAECACLLQNPALLQAALEFNGFYTPPNPGAESGPLAEHLQTSLAAQPRLWRFFPMPAQGKTVWCFEPAPNRLALLPPPLLERLSLYWSAAVWAEDLSRIIEKTRLAQVMAQIGPEVYRYAVRRGRFQLGGLRPSLRSGLKDAFARTTEWDAEIFHQPGERILALCVAHWPGTLRIAWEERWQQLLPEPLPVRQAVSFPALWLWVKKILCTEVAPEWQPCFSS
ncbi:MAG: hypothetical protein LBI62_08115 [Candidatus Accumulibacter sp.]|jgi:hypothetical protein|nr:hypothetical protein [Accumulibacter sp.]